MQQKEIILINKGMRRDLSVSKAEESSAYDNRNIRITTTDKDTLLSVTNERGNKVVDGMTFSGVLIGHAVLNDYIVLFTIDDKTSRIYRVEYTGSGFKSLVLFEGALGFDTEHPIETLADYETEDIQKVYWLDGKNVLRFINISDTYLKAHLEEGYTLDNPKFTFADYTDWFDSTRSSETTPSVTLTKNNSGNSRANGVVQYFLTYYNKNGQQTGIIYSSPLVYLTPEDRGGAADQTNNNRIVISVSGLDKSFECVRLYSIVRTSRDGSAVGYIVADSSIIDGEAVFVDDGAHLEAVDPTSFLFLGSSTAVFGTMTQKDGTLFLGNMKSVGYSGVNGIETAVKETAFILSGDGFTPGKDWESAIVSFRYSDDKDIDSPTGHIPHITASGYYPYKSQLQYTNAQISTFKGGEKYRFALRFIRSNGTMSKPFWIGDKVNPYYPTMSYSSRIRRAVAVCVVPKAIVDAAEAGKFSSVQLMIAQATYSDRSVQAQGIVCPTVFNLFDRYSGKDFVQSSWIYRPRRGAYPYSHLSVMNNSNTPHAEIQCNWWDDGVTKDRKGGSSDSHVPTPLYYTDSDGKLVNAPAGTLSYNYISLQIIISAFRMDFFPAYMYSGSVYVEYFDSAEELAPASNYNYKNLLANGFTNNSRRASIVSQVLSAYDEFGIPVSMRADAGTIYGWLDAAKNNSGLFRAGYYVENQGKQKADDYDYDVSASFARLSREYYFVDESIVTLNSPEISHEAVSLDRNSGLKFRIVGAALMSGNISDYSIETENREYPGGNSVVYSFSHQNISDDVEGLSAWPLYSEYGYKKGSDGGYEQVYAPYNYMMYMWHKSGSIPPFSKDGKSWSVLTKKLFANLHFSCYSLYNNYGVNSWVVTPTDVRQVSAAGADAYELKRGSDTVIYAADIDKAVLVPDTVEYPVYFSKDVVYPAQGLTLATTDDSIQSVSDPVNITYRSAAHAVIGLPISTGDTLLPYMDENEAYTFNTEAGAPHASWQSSSTSGQTLLYRVVSSLTAEKIADVSDGAYGTFEYLAETNDRYLMRASCSAMGNTTVTAMDAMLEKVAAAGKTVYVHLKYTKDSSANKVIITDAARIITDKTSVKAGLSSNLVKLIFNSELPMTSIYYALYKEGEVIASNTVQLNGKTNCNITLRPSGVSWSTILQLAYKITYGTYIGDDKQTYNIVEALDRTAEADRIRVYFLYTTYTAKRYYILDKAKVIDPFTNDVEYTFLNIAYTPNYKFKLDAEHKITNLGTSVDEYRRPIQNLFELSDASMMEDAQKYLYIGELYHDYDGLSANNPALDTRYGGITESAVEGNTFIQAGPRMPLSHTEFVEDYSQVTLDTDDLFSRILNKTSSSGSSYKLNLLSSPSIGDDGLVSHGIMEQIDLQSLNGITADDLLPTSSDKVSGLRVQQTEDGWVSVIDGLDDAFVALLSKSDYYKIAVLRNGYARRGKWRKYINKYGTEQTSHTSRNNYRKFRRGYRNGLPAYRLRIIGIDLLIAGNQSGDNDFKKHSQTYQCYYKDATLISNLGDKLIMPTRLDSDGLPSFKQTRDNRFCQRSAADITELFIGLYHLENSGWKLASNVVQVRGRNEAKTQIWEFDKTNIIASTE